MKRGAKQEIKHSFGNDFILLFSSILKLLIFMNLLFKFEGFNVLADLLNQSIVFGGWEELSDPIMRE